MGFNTTESVPLSLKTSDFQYSSTEVERSETGAKRSVIVYPGSEFRGLLLEILWLFAKQNINLTCIEFRPSVRRLGDDLYYTDLASGLSNVVTSEALQEIETILENR